MSRRARLLGSAVLAIRYVHAEDGERYEHKFETPVEMWVEPDGSIRLVSVSGLPLAEEFED